MNKYFLFDLTQILISNKFEKEIVFESSIFAWIQIRIRIEQKCWIRIRIKSIRIHNPGFLMKKCKKASANICQDNVPTISRYFIISTLLTWSVIKAQVQIMLKHKKRKIPITECLGIAMFMKTAPRDKQNFWDVYGSSHC
jgi:hypothetical protein